MPCCIYIFSPFCINGLFPPSKLTVNSTVFAEGLGISSNIAFICILSVTTVSKLGDHPTSLLPSGKVILSGPKGLFPAITTSVPIVSLVGFSI